MLSLPSARVGNRIYKHEKHTAWEIDIFNGGVFFIDGMNIIFSLVQLQMTSPKLFVNKYKIIRNEILV